jgi:hypothetical protein
MSEEDRSYFEARVEQELRMAQAARSPEAARAHRRLAGIYRTRIDAVPPPTPERRRG